MTASVFIGGNSSGGHASLVTDSVQSFVAPTASSMTVGSSFGQAAQSFQKGRSTHHRASAMRAFPDADVSLLMASTLPTPAVVSMAFNVITFLPQYLWLLMVFAPNWEFTQKIMKPIWPCLVFACVHLFIVFTVASNNSDNLEEFTTLAQVFNPAVSVNLFGDFSPQDSMMKLMKSPGFVSEEWSHVLAWDLFVGRWIYLDGLRRGIFASHSVLLCNLIGPPGLLSHAITCLVLGKKLPGESETDTVEAP